MSGERGRNFKAIASDVAEGFISVNPIFLKSYDEQGIKLLAEALERKQGAIRTEPFPFNDAFLIRKRNLRLQRLYGALIVLKNFARERKYKIN